VTALDTLWPGERRAVSVVAASAERARSEQLIASIRRLAARSATRAAPSQTLTCSFAELDEPGWHITLTSKF
jgi:hypothetical protein